MYVDLVLFDRVHIAMVLCCLSVPSSHLSFLVVNTIDDITPHKLWFITRHLCNLSF